MFDTLYKKLSIVLFGLVCLIGFFLFLFVRYATELYQQEVNQRLNAALADQIVTEQWLLENGRVNHDALRHIFHNMMVINPSIELYLLDPKGRILAFSAPKGKVKRSTVDLDVVRRFIDGVPNYPVLGDDPRSEKKQKVFSSARIPAEYEDPLEGYLYVILGGEAYDSATEMIQGSYTIRLSMIGLGGGLLIAFVAGVLLFALLTRRLSRLASLMRAYSENNGDFETGTRFRLQRHGRDEIDRLGATFNAMADRIDEQLAALRQNDANRRESIAGVSHDLRTPLTALHGYLETLSLKEGTLSLQERQNFIGIAIRHSEQLIKRVNDLFELAKLDSVNPMLLTVERFSMGEVIQDVVQQFELTAKAKGVVITTDLGADNLPNAYGDISLIHRVLINLLDNAIRYTQEGGRITLSINPGRQKIAVAISDSGCGIAKEELPFIFDRFYRSKSSRSERGHHSGLGLAIVKRILALHDSDISVKSDTLFGTTFFFNIKTDPLS